MSSKAKVTSALRSIPDTLSKSEELLLLLVTEPWGTTLLEPLILPDDSFSSPPAVDWRTVGDSPHCANYK